MNVARRWPRAADTMKLSRIHIALAVLALAFVLGRRPSLLWLGLLAAGLGGNEYVGEHILVWAVHHDRVPPDDCDVHHIDGDRTNNSPDNLELRPMGHHFRVTAELHARIRELEEENKALRETQDQGRA